MPKLTMTLKLITEQILNKSFNIFFVLFCFVFFWRACKHPAFLWIHLSRNLKVLYNGQLSITAPK